MEFLDHRPGLWRKKLEAPCLQQHLNGNIYQLLPKKTKNSNSFDLAELMARWNFRYLNFLVSGVAANHKAKTKIMIAPASDTNRFIPGRPSSLQARGSP